MDYDAVAALFLVPTDATPAPPVVPASAARRLRDAVEPIATIGWWSREAATSVQALGHEFFEGYVWGRAAALGADVDASVVVAAFGVFEPAVLTAIYEHARTVSTHDDILRARADAATAALIGAAASVDIASVARFGDVLLGALAGLDGGGRPLFSALRRLPLPDSPHGRAWRAAELVREHRGDGHVAACVAAGLDAVEMSVLTEVWLDFALGEYSTSRAFGLDRITAAAAGLQAAGLLDGDSKLTELGRAMRDRIEASTDHAQQALVAALGEDLEEITAIAETIGTAVLAAHAAPADPRKRAAG